MSARLLGERYEVGELLGRGGMAEVHAGHDTRLGRRVAVKLLRSDMARDPVFQARFRREAQSAAGLNHPSVVAVYDTGEDVAQESGGAPVRLPWIVMEYVEGRTVRELLDEAGGHGLGTERAVAITAQVLVALGAAHASGIVHRDVKPANVMITTAGDVKVMDFGIARAMADSSATMTQTSAVIGTAQYLSPEQARGEVVDARSDLYSTACLLYEVLTGRPPFLGDSAVAVAYQHVRELPSPPSTYNRAVDDEMDRVVLKALAKDRDERYDDAEAFREDLLAAEAGQPVLAPAVAVSAAAGAAALPTATEATRALAGAGYVPAQTGATQHVSDQLSTGPLPTAPPPDRARRWLVALLVVLLLALLAVGALYVQRSIQAANQVTVPQLVRQSQEQAQQTLQGLRLASTTEARADAQAAGVVLDQSVAAGTRVDPGTSVLLTVSSGPAAVTVPAVVDLSEVRAAAALTSVGLVEGPPVVVDDPTKPQGQVISSDPAAGTSVAPGTSVVFTLSSGRVALPDLRRQSEAEAVQAVKTLGLLPFTSEQPSTEAAPGTVIGQSPLAGSVVAGSQVIIIVAAAPETTAAPPTETVTETATSSPSPTGGDDGGDSSDGTSSPTSSPTPSTATSR